MTAEEDIQRMTQAAYKARDTMRSSLVKFAKAVNDMFEEKTQWAVRISGATINLYDPSGDLLTRETALEWASKVDGRYKVEVGKVLWIPDPNEETE